MKTTGYLWCTRFLVRLISIGIAAAALADEPNEVGKGQGSEKKHEGNRAPDLTYQRNPARRQIDDPDAFQHPGDWRDESRPGYRCRPTPQSLEFYWYIMRKVGRGEEINKAETMVILWMISNRTWPEAPTIEDRDHAAAEWANRQDASEDSSFLTDPVGWTRRKNADLIYLQQNLTGRTDQDTPPTEGVEKFRQYWHGKTPEEQAKLPIGKLMLGWYTRLGYDMRSDKERAKDEAREKERLEKLEEAEEKAKKQKEADEKQIAKDIKDWFKKAQERDEKMQTASEAASKLVEEGIQLQQQGRLKDAIERYKRSLQFWPDPEVQDHVARLEAELAKTNAKKTDNMGVEQEKPIPKQDPVPKREPVPTSKGKTEQYAWIRVGILDFDYDHTNPHPSYAISTSYGRGSYTFSETYTGDDIYGEGKSGTLSVKAVFSQPPKIIYPEEPVEIRIKMTTLQNTVVKLHFTAGGGVNFDMWDITPSTVTRSHNRDFRNVEGNFYFKIHSLSGPKSYDEVVSCSYRAGREEGERIAVRQRWAGMATYYVYEWRILKNDGSREDIEPLDDTLDHKGESNRLPDEVVNPEPSLTEDKTESLTRENEVIKPEESKNIADKLARAKELVKQGKLDEAIQEARDASKTDPQNKEAKSYTSLLVRERERVHAQIEKVRKLIAANKLDEAEKELVVSKKLFPKYGPVVETEKLIKTKREEYKKKIAETQSRKSIQGTYSTGWGQMTITQTGDKITGTYAHQDGKIEGTLKGFTVTGKWHQSNGNNGLFVFNFKSDFSAFTGQWSYDNDEPSGKWNGVRIESNR